MKKDKLNIKTMPYEIAHYISESLEIFSYKNRMIFISNNSKVEIKMPFIYLDLLGFNRMMRRLFRLDKCNIYPLDLEGESFLLIRQNVIYKYYKGNITGKFKLGIGRNILFNPLCITPSGRIFIGEYSSNKNRRAVKIYASDDNGDVWYKIYSFSPKKVRHIHGIFYDYHTAKIWVTTGDNNGECYIVISDESFLDVKYLGDGGQLWRTVNLFFEKDRVVWLMDSPNETPYVIFLDRKTYKIKKGSLLPGPVIYSKKIDQNNYMAVVSSEPGKLNPSKLVHLLFSNNLVKWDCLETFKKDYFPMILFQFGNINFADGLQTSNQFYLSFQGVQSLDGTVGKCEIIHGS
jgi:hypothetical protein